MGVPRVYSRVSHGCTSGCTIPTMCLSGCTIPTMCLSGCTCPRGVPQGVHVREVYLRVSLTGCTSGGPYRGVPYPFHCWASLRTSLVLDILPVMKLSDGHMSGVCVMLPVTRFTVGHWVFPLFLPVLHLLSRF